MFNKYKLLFEMLKCVHFGNFKLSSGKISPYKIDIDALTKTQKEIEFLANEALKFSRHSGFKPDYFVGVPSGATILATEMTRKIDYLSDKNIVWREKKNSKYNGLIESGDKVVVIEDVVTTGKSIEGEIKNLSFEGAKIIGAISLVDRLERNEDFDFPYAYAIGIDEIFEVLKRQNKIPEEYKEKVDAYMKLNVRQIA